MLFGAAEYQDDTNLRRVFALQVATNLASSFVKPCLFCFPHSCWRFFLPMS